MKRPRFRTTEYTSGNQVLVALLTGLLVACQSPAPPKQLTPAFYHWQATYQLDPTEKALLREVKASRLYIRFFDVDWDAAGQRPVPKAVVHFREEPVGQMVVPVVFITNRTLLLMAPATIPQLARNLVDKIRQMARQQHIQLREVQLDCDWSVQSRACYFQLLRTVSQLLGLPLSATIRLHQVKYVGQTGVPPVSRGMLMVYNMTDWKDPETRNSILDLDVTEHFTNFLEKYPLPLDAVLPLFNWTIVYRNNRFLTILNGVERSTLQRCSALRVQADTNRFVARRDTVALGLSVRAGDLFRAEACSLPELMQARQLVLSRIRNPALTFALYHLDSTVLSHYRHGDLKTLFQPNS
ncbi:hypothetical protein [Spirosoma koreense]